MATLVEKRNELAAKNKTLFQMLEAGKTDNGALDVDKIDGLKTFPTSVEKAAEIRRLNAELTALGKEIDDLVALEKAAEDTRKREDDLKTPAGGITHPNGGGQKDGERKTLGRMFVESEAYKSRVRNGVGPEALLKDADLGHELKTVMSTGAGWAAESLRIPGLVIPSAQRPLNVIDVIPTGSTGQAAVVYMEETTLTNNAAEAAESADGSLVTYGESALAFTERSVTVRKIATWMPVTDEQLEDIEGIEDYINNRLVFMIRQRLDSQLLVGGGTGSDLTGYLNATNIQSQALGSDPVPDAIYKAMDKVIVTGRANPTAVFLHPNDWQPVRLLRTADGVYIWGSPSEAGPERIWGLPVIKTTAETENTGLVGDFSPAMSQLYIKRGIEVQVSNSHSSYFVQGVQAVRADMRCALVQYRGTAFCKVTGL